MSAAVMVSELDAALAAFEDAADRLATLDLTLCTDDQVLDGWRRVETVRRRLEPVDHRFITQVQSRNLAFTHGCRTPALFAQHLLRIHPGEASARIRAAEVLGPRRALSGEQLEPICPTVAAAQADGAISARQARIIVDTIEALPVEIQAVHDRHVETELTGFARDHDPAQLARRARELANRLDQDGRYKDLGYRERTRGVRIIDRPDGSAHIDGDLTAELTEHLHTVFDSLAAPTPATDGTRDPRTAGQRNHDALLELAKIGMKSGLMPNTAGVTATILLRMDLNSFATGTGTAFTGHGVPIPVEEAIRWAGPNFRAILTLLSDTKGIEAYSTVQRLYTEPQRLAMMTRDKGCSFTGCDAPPAWTESHHMTEYQHTQRTSVDDGGVLCRHNHRHFEQIGWHGVMINGRPHWAPPKWIDPTQTPRRNTMHDGIDDEPDG